MNEKGVVNILREKYFNLRRETNLGPPASRIVRKPVRHLDLSSGTA